MIYKVIIYNDNVIYTNIHLLINIINAKKSLRYFEKDVKTNILQLIKANIEQIGHQKYA